MARYSGIRIDRDLRALVGRFTVDGDVITQLFMTHILNAAEAATRRMQDRIIRAETQTGRDRHEATGGRPGRYKTGALYKSLRGPGGQPATVVASNTKAGRVVFRIGYQVPVLNRRGQDYRSYQEFRSYTISGRLLAAQEGFNYFVKTVFDEMAKAANEVGDILNGKRYQARSANAMRAQANLRKMRKS